MPRWIGLCLCMLGPLWLLLSPHSWGQDPQIAQQAWVTLHHIEQANGIPRGLLHAMSLVETGQGLEGQILPWPYTVGVNPTARKNFTTPAAALTEVARIQNIGFPQLDLWIGRHKFPKISPSVAENLLKTAAPGEISVQARHFSKRFGSSQEATQFVHRILSAGYDNLDLGLMQINWAYHAANFPSVRAALDPYQNASYAVKYLLDHRQTRDWWGSVGRYHSGTPVYAQRYIQNVYNMYRKVHRLAEPQQVAQVG